jgi:hypothetical protein
VTKKIDHLPAAVPGRLAYAGVSLYGFCWKSRLAAGLGIGRTTLHQWMTGGKRDRDIDGEIADLIDRERDAASVRAVALTDLRNRFLRVKKVAA